MHRFVTIESDTYSLAIDTMKLLHTDINECQVDPHVCSQVCNNTDGGYFCDCHSGYTLAEDSTSCIGTYIQVCSWPVTVYSHN